MKLLEIPGVREALERKDLDEVGKAGLIACALRDFIFQRGKLIGELEVPPDLPEFQRFVLRSLFLKIKEATSATEPQEVTETKVPF